MKQIGALLILAVVAGWMADGSVVASDPAAAEVMVKPHTARVFYLQGMSSRDAITLLRMEAQILQAAWIGERDVVVVAGTAEKVDQCEDLLQQRDALFRVAEPHEPVALEGVESSLPETRVFLVDGDNLQTVVTVLRSIYQVRELSELAENNSVSVSASKPVLDSSEALLQELELLVK